ncbi:hypothetical protein OH799_25450 [Nocardia sp. NBC_00881]|uniref:hypothetical protein n=1 Tax=Nocardia sp. NBC_00881 TaxID=2975995 RepID=UPI003869B4B9|nr:hypothetical protein OH799_25450 [Nocardia sp. NBC_00881]
MPKFASSAVVSAGLYQWVGEQLEAAYAVPDPRLVFAAAEDIPVSRLVRCRNKWPGSAKVCR